MSHILCDRKARLTAMCTAWRHWRCMRMRKDAYPSRFTNTKGFSIIPRREKLGLQRMMDTDGAVGKDCSSRTVPTDFSLADQSLFVFTAMPEFYCLYFFIFRLVSLILFDPFRDNRALSFVVNVGKTFKKKEKKINLDFRKYWELQRIQV